MKMNIKHNFTQWNILINLNSNKQEVVFHVLLKISYSESDARQLQLRIFHSVRLAIVASSYDLRISICSKFKIYIPEICN